MWAKNLYGRGVRSFVPQDDKHASCRSDEVPAKLCNETTGGCGLAGDVLRAHSDKPNTYHALQLRILMAEGQDPSFLRMTRIVCHSELLLRRV
jgi:hypothetical protein